MSRKEIDFIERLLETLNNQMYYAEVIMPALAPGNSIAVMPMPANEYEHYYDGSYRQGYAFQIMTKHENQLTSYMALLNITNALTNVIDIPSDYDLYTFEGIDVTTDPNGIGRDERQFVCAAQYRANLFIKG